MGAARRLIVNADGFGFGAGATQGILDAVREGNFISSVSVNANFPDAARLGELVSEFPNVSIGVHLNPMVGQPCLPPKRVSSLVDAHGFFYGKDFPKLLKAGCISREQLEAELDAQICKIKKLAGDRLTHLDSQANKHLDYFELFLILAGKWGLKRMRNNASLICLESDRPAFARLRTYVRKPHVWIAHRYRRYQMVKARKAGMRMADNLITIGYAGAGSKAHLTTWLSILKNLPCGTHEIYCHPAYPDETLRRWSYYQDERGLELEILRGEGLRNEAKRLGVELISFDAI